MTDIILAPRPKLEIPKIIGPLSELPPADADILFGIPSRRRPPAPAVMVEPGGEESTTVPGEFAGTPTAGPRFSEGFRLIGRGQAPGQTGQDRLRLTIPERQPAGVETKPSFFSSPRVGDLRKYVQVGLPGSAGIPSGRAVGRRAGGTPSQVRLVSPALLQIDLSPWARKAVDLIQKNWSLPGGLTSEAEVTAEVAIVVLKNGQISVIEIVTPSADPDFDHAAREAIEMSSPLPPLPADFPATSLEVTLIFAKQ